jgi:hypothetical protein
MESKIPAQGASEANSLFQGTAAASPPNSQQVSGMLKFPKLKHAQPTFLCLGGHGLKNGEPNQLAALISLTIKSDNDFAIFLSILSS